jgi:hypothetical protein
MIQIYKDPHYIERFAIYGERHSGTNFLQQTISQAFKIDITSFFGHKHWMGFANEAKISCNRQILFFGIVRHPYDWLNGFFKLPHHVPKCNQFFFEKFLLNEWYSIDNNKKEIMSDRNFTTKPNLVRYKNIFELRKTKINFLSETMPEIAKNYVLINYEFLVNYHEKFIKLISSRFNLPLINKSPVAPIYKNPIILDTKIKNIVDSNIDWSSELIFGYGPR